MGLIQRLDIWNLTYIPSVKRRRGVYEVLNCENRSLVIELILTAHSQLKFEFIEKIMKRF